MTDNKLVATIRTSFGKGAARAVRREGNIPAVMYGHGTDPVHICLPGHQTMMALKLANALLTIEIDGKDQLALAKDVQRDVLTRFIDHIDLVVVRLGEKVTVDVPVHVVGTAAVDTVVTVENNTVQLAVEATHIPERVEVSVEGVKPGTQILARDLVLPEGRRAHHRRRDPHRQRHAGHLRGGPRGRARRSRCRAGPGCCRGSGRRGRSRGWRGRGPCRRGRQGLSTLRTARS